MTYRLPTALADDDSRAVTYLRTYYGLDGGPAYTGSYFDAWGPTQDSDRFTAEDVVAVSFLSVFVPPMAAHRLLVTEADRYAELLHSLGPDRDLVDEDEPIDASWPARRLNRALLELPDVGPTRAAKLIARKRPRLIPIYDSVVAEVTNAFTSQWEPLRQTLRADDGALHHRLVRLRELTGLAAHISPLRVYDVVTWMEGKDRGLTGS